jgi:trigger factor
VAFEIIPEFELKDHAGLELAAPCGGSDRRPDRRDAEALSSQSKNFEDKQGAAEKGDRLTINFVGTIDGTAFEGGTAEDVALEIGSGQFIPGFEDQLIGAKAGDDVTVKVTFPETYGVPALAGKAAEFATKVTKVEGPEGNRHG